MCKLGFLCGFLLEPFRWGDSARLLSLCLIWSKRFLFLYTAFCTEVHKAAKLFHSSLTVKFPTSTSSEVIIGIRSQNVGVFFSEEGELRKTAELNASMHSLPHVFLIYGKMFFYLLFQDVLTFTDQFSDWSRIIQIGLLMEPCSVD